MPMATQLDGATKFNCAHALWPSSLGSSAAGIERGGGALSPFCFFCVVILVRLGKKFFDALAIAAVDGDSDTRGEAGRFIVGGEDFADAIGDAARFVLLRFRQDEGELVTAVSRGGVNGAAMNPENVGEAADGAAADEMAVTVVNRFEAIKIKKQHGEGTAGAVGALRLVFENVEEAAVVRETGEGIADGKMVNLFEEASVFKQRASERDGVAQHHERLGKDEWGVEQASRLSGRELGGNV